MTTIYPPGSFLDNLRTPFNQQAVTGAALPLYVASKVMYSTAAALATAGHVTAVAQVLSGAKDLDDGLQLSGGQLVTAISVSPTLLEDSDSYLATQRAIKNYVDNSPGTLLTTGPERITETSLPVGILDFYTNNLLRLKLTTTSQIYTPFVINAATPRLELLDVTGGHSWVHRLTGTTLESRLDGNTVVQTNGTLHESLIPFKVTSATQPQVEIFNGAATSSLSNSATGVLQIAASGHVETLANSSIVAPKPLFTMTDTLTANSFITEVDATALQVYHGVDKLSILTPTAMSFSRPVVVATGANTITIANELVTFKPKITASNGLPVLIPTGVQLEGTGPVYNAITVDANQNFKVATPRWKHANATSFLKGLGGSAATQTQIGTLVYYAWEFNNVSTKETFASFPMPVDIVGSNASMVAIFNWTAIGVGAGNVHWNVVLDVAAPNAVHGVTTYTFNLITAYSTVPYTNQRSLANTITLVAPVKGSSILARVSRIKDASDTLVASVWLMDLAFAYTADKIIGDSAAL
jgi:hypothetical protein